MEFVETDIQDFLDDLFNQEEAKDYTNLTDAQINYYIRPYNMLFIISKIS